MEQRKVAYVKSQRYVDQKLAPEKIDVASVVSLANAAKLAKEKSLLDAGVIDLMLPNLMVEGRPTDYGVNSVELPGRSTVPKQLNIDSWFFNPNGVDPKTQTIKPDKTKLLAIPVGMPDAVHQDLNARLVIAALTQKQETANRLAAKSGRTPTAEDVIQLWNGTGKDSERHISRVREADRLLKTDPANKEIKALWDGILETLPSAPVDATNSQQSSTLLATMINDYDSSK